MKVLFITRDRSNRGGQVVLINLVRELRSQGYEVELVTFRPEGESDFPDCERLWEGINPTIITIPFSEDKERQGLLFIRAAEEYLKGNEKRFDRIIIDSWYMLHAAVKANIISEKVLHLVQSDPEFIAEDITKFWKSELFAMLPRFPVQKIIVSWHLERIFRERYGIESNFLRLFIDQKYFEAQFEVKDRKELRLISTSADFNIPSKGLDFLLDELSRFDAFPFTLTLMSGKPIKKDLTDLPFDVSGATGQDPDEMIKFLSAHDVYINTSTNESFCLCLAEALAVGMPAIALDSGGNRDYMNADNGLFVHDGKDFRKELARLSDFEFRKSLSKHARESVRQYTIKETIECFKQIIKI